MQKPSMVEARATSYSQLARRCKVRLLLPALRKLLEKLAAKQRRCPLPPVAETLGASQKPGARVRAKGRVTRTGAI